MRIRLGYVSLSKALEETSSHTLSYTNYLKNENGLKSIDMLIKINLESLEHIIDYNIKNNIHFYRMSSALIPLATKKDVVFDYIEKYKDIYEIIGNKIKQANMRVDFHPDEFCVINSVKPEVLENTLEILKYHYSILEALQIEHKVLIVHVGSNVFGKYKSLKRFVKEFYKLPEEIRECIAVENDDKIFNIKDVLNLCKEINCKMVLDYHHYICNHEEENIKDLYVDIFNTWKKENPKIHFSSPKNKTKKEIRSHSDYINSNDFILFLEQVKHLPFDIDIMLEAKAKDDALFRLVRELKYKTNYTWIDETSFYLE